MAGIPSLILLDPAGRLITSTGRVALLDDRLGLRFPWEPAALSQLSPTNAELLNQEPALVLFVGKLAFLPISHHSPLVHQNLVNTSLKLQPLTFISVDWIILVLSKQYNLMVHRSCQVTRFSLCH